MHINPFITSSSVLYALIKLSKAVTAPVDYLPTKILELSGTLIRIDINLRSQFTNDSSSGSVLVPPINTKN